MDFDPTTFCAAPWFQIRNEQFGEYKSCPIIDKKCSQFKDAVTHKWPTHSPEEYLNSEYAIYLRKNLTSGVKLPECHRCWSQEDAGNYSVRQELNNTISNNRGNNLSNSWIKPYLDQKTDYTFDHLIRADIKLSNICNYSCVMCNPGDSSQIYSAWSTDKEHPVVKDLLAENPKILQLVRENYKDKNNYKLLELLLSQRPAYLKLLGGEPLLDKQALAMLKAANGKNTSLLFVTNGSVDLVDISELLSNYRDVNFVVSLDGIGSVQDYIRQGSSWQSVSANIDQWLEKYPNKKLSVHTTVQALNLAHIGDLIEWTASRNIILGMNVLSSPGFLGLASIPEEVRNNIKLPDCFDLQNTLDASKFDPDLLAQLKKYIAWYDPDQTWQKVLPEWINVLK